VTQVTTRAGFRFTKVKKANGRKRFPACARKPG
jgi:hypothetical protein